MQYDSIAHIAIIFLHLYNMTVYTTVSIHVRLYIRVHVHTVHTEHNIHEQLTRQQTKQHNTTQHNNMYMYYVGDRDWLVREVSSDSQNDEHNHHSYHYSHYHTCTRSGGHDRRLGSCRRTHNGSCTLSIIIKKNFEESVHVSHYYVSKVHCIYTIDHIQCTSRVLNKYTPKQALCRHKHNGAYWELPCRGCIIHACGIPPGVQCTCTCIRAIL